MPRPQRPGWRSITITLSEEVATALRIRSAATGTEMGTLADSILREPLKAILEQIPSLVAELPFQPIPSIQESPKVEDLAAADDMPAAAPTPPEGSQSHPCASFNGLAPNPKFDDPDVRAEYEARFLDEVLQQVSSPERMEQFISSLEGQNVYAYQETGAFRTDLPMREELKIWRRTRQIPSSWKADVRSVAKEIADEDGGDWEASIFDGRLGPDEFYEWAQPS